MIASFVLYLQIFRLQHVFVVKHFITSDAQHHILSIHPADFHVVDDSLQSLYDDYFSEHSSSSLYRYATDSEKTQTVSFLNRTHSRRTVNLSPSSTATTTLRSAPTVHKMQIDDVDGSGETADIDMKPVRKQQDRVSNHQAAPRQNAPKSTSSVLGRRSFGTAFEHKEDHKGDRPGCHLLSGYQITMPLFKKQRI